MKLSICASVRAICLRLSSGDVASCASTFRLEAPWQVVGTYGFDTTCLGTPLHAVIGYRALSVDFSESGKFGKNGIDWVQHGPIMGVTFRW
jgi:hypothetical protein